MNLKIKIELDRNNEEAKKDIELMQKILRKNGVNMFHIERMGGEEIYRIRGNEERIAKKMSRGAGAKPKTLHLKIETILEIEKSYYRKPKEKAAALQQYGIGVRRYQQIKKKICDVFGSLEQAIQYDYIYFVYPNDETIRNFAIRKSRENCETIDNTCDFDESDLF